MNMKSKTIIGLLFSLLLFTACSNNNGTNVNTPTIDPVGGPVVTAQPTPTAEIKQDRQLTIEELDKVNRLIDYNQKDGNYITAFLSMYRSFKSKNEIKIDSIISSLRAGDDMLTDDDVEEIADLKAEGLNISFDDIELDNRKYYKHSYDKVNNILYKYTGLTIDQLGEDGMKDAVYSEKYKCFYTPSRGGWTSFNCIDGLETEDKIYLYSRYNTLVIEKAGENYYIDGFYHEEHLNSLYPPDNKKEKSFPYDYEMDELVIKDEFIPRDNTKSRRYNTVIKAYNRLIAEISKDRLIEYVLFDLNGDNTPELILIPQYRWGSMIVYTYLNGTVTELPGPEAYGGDGGSRVLSNGMIAGYMRKPYGRWYDFFIYGKGGTAELITFGIFYEAPEYKSIYKYNDKEVSRREYISLTKDYLDYFDSMADLDWQWTHSVKQ